MLSELQRTLRLIGMSLVSVDFEKGKAVAESTGAKVLLVWDKRRQWWDVRPILALD